MGYRHFAALVLSVFVVACSDPKVAPTEQTDATVEAAVTEPGSVEARQGDLSEFFNDAGGGAFEYHGIKSGMTIGEVAEVLDEKGAKAFFEKKYRYLDWRGFSRFADMDYPEVVRMDGPYQLVFSFTDEDTLYGLTAFYKKESDTLKHFALLDALKTKFPSRSIDEGTTVSQYGSDDYVAIQFVDIQLALPAMERYRGEYLGKLGQTPAAVSEATP